MDDFLKAVKRVQPSAKREGFATVPNVTWEQVGALERIRDELNVTIVQPLKRTDKIFSHLGLTNPAGILLYFFLNFFFCFPKKILIKQKKKIWTTWMW